MESIPMISQQSGRAKRVKKGAFLAQAAGKIYGAKGNNTLEWWNFNPNATDAPKWAEGVMVPYGSYMIKEGAGAVTVVIDDVPYIYTIKGSNTLEFYRYNTQTALWETKADLPLGSSGRRYKNGSCIAYNPDLQVIYLVKGNYNEFYSYDIATNVWSTKISVPLTGSAGRPKKVKDGAGMAYMGGKTYLVKGNNTLEFWYYDDATNAWAMRPDVPIGGGKRVKGGGALTLGRMPVTGLYLFKGNNNTEFWGYLPAVQFASTQPELSGNAMGGKTGVVVSGKLAVAPNPFSGGTTVNYALPKAGNVSIKLFDATGSLVSTVTETYANAGTYTARIDASKLARGIYLLKLNSESYNSTQKLILE
jgi:hypothetical protein